MGLRLASEGGRTGLKIKVIWSSDVANYPPDLVSEITRYISGKGRQIKIEDTAIGFFQNLEPYVQICVVGAQFINGASGTQHIIFRKKKGGVWEAIQESEIMPPGLKNVKQLDDPSLCWTILKE